MLLFVANLASQCDAVVKKYDKSGGVEVEALLAAR
jgi:hypothetical protein